MPRTYILKAALGAYILFLFALALVFFRAPNPVPNFVPFRSIVRDWNVGGWPFIVNFAGNIVAFIPMGVVPPLLFRRPPRAWQVAIFGLFLSLAIELGQYIDGQRVTDIDDVTLNTAGTLLGYCAFVVFSRTNQRDRGAAKSAPGPEAAGRF